VHGGRRVCMVGGECAWWEESVHGGRRVCMVGGECAWWEESVHDGRTVCMVCCGEWSVTVL
jgi:hypothetical protein